MKKYSYLVSVLLCWLTSGTSVYAQSVNSSSEEKSVNDVENRTAYAVVSYDEAMDGYGVSTFKTGTQQSITLLHEWGNEIGILSGAAAYGDYYGYFYQYDNISMVIPLSFSKINLQTGAITDVKDWSNVRVKFQDMTFDYSTNTMYAVGYDNGDSKLYTIDIKTGDITEGPIFKTNSGQMTLATLAATYDGRLYGLNSYGVLYQIDKESGNLTRVLDIQLTLQSMQTMEFDHTDEALYWCSDTYDKSDPALANSLYKIDIEKKTFKSLGHLGGGYETRVVGLYIPFVKAGFSDPEQVSDLLVTPAKEGKEEAVITWKNPTTTHGGDALTGNLTVVLERNDKPISSSFGEAGAEMSWTDNTVKQGENRYSVKVSNSVGEGLGADYDAYIGHDVPGRTEDLEVTSGNECKSIKLKWTIPEKGAHNGYYNPSDVKYKIVRYPDNVVLENNYSGTTYEDGTIKRLGAYYYGITATNEAGTNNEYIKKEVVIAGKAIDIPYNIGFEDESTAMNQWSIFNANKDGCKLHINSGFDMLIYGQEFFANGIDYVADPQTSQLDADEWLISPPLNFEANKDYYISFDTRSAGIDELAVTFGDRNTPEAQTEMVKFGVFTEAADPDNPQFQPHKFQLPKSEGIHCVGINLLTVFGESIIFQLNNLEIAEGVVTGIKPAINSKDVNVSTDGNQLTIEGEFKTADIYDTTGVRIVSISKDNARISTVEWQPGIYIVKIAGDNTVYTKKIMVK